MINIRCTHCPVISTGFTVLDALRDSDAHGEEHAEDSK